MPNVTVTQPSVIKVQVGGKPTAVQSINYGSKTILGSADLTVNNANTGDVIVYNASNNTFSVASVLNTITDLDGGFF